MKNIYRTKREIIGAFGKWILRQYPHWDFQEPLFFPAIRAVEKACDQWGKQAGGVLNFETTETADSDERLRDFISGLIMGSYEIVEYNRNEVERSGGAKTPDYGFVSRDGGLPPEKDFIDLDALERNVYYEILNSEPQEDSAEKSKAHDSDWVRVSDVRAAVEKMKYDPDGEVIMDDIYGKGEARKENNVLDRVIRVISNLSPHDKETQIT